MLRTCLTASILFSLAVPNVALARRQPAATPPAPVPVAKDVAPINTLPPTVPSKRRANLVLAGAMTVGLTYVFTSLAGAIAIDKAKHGHDDPLTVEIENPVDRRRRAFGRALLVPVAGPFFAIGYTDSAVRRWGAAASGSIQLLGVAMIAAGAIISARERRARRFGMTASLQPGGASIGISGRF